MGERFPIDRLWGSGWAVPAHVTPRHVLLVDDEPFVRAGIAAVLLQLAPGLKVSEAGDLGAAIREVWRADGTEEAVDLVLLDLNLPDAHGLETLSAFRRQCPLMAVAVVSGQQDARTVFQAQEMGALCFIPKSCHAGQARQALERLMSLPRFPAHVRSPEQEVPLLGLTAAPVSLCGLTDRQAEVLERLGQGMTNKQIARLLNITESTVKIHVSAILRELGVSNRTQALIKAARLGRGAEYLSQAPEGTGHDA